MNSPRDLLSPTPMRRRDRDVAGTRSPRWLAPLLTGALALMGGCGDDGGSCCAGRVEAAAIDADPAVAARRASVNIPDHELVDQHGHKHRLMSDLIRGKKVVIDFVFTTCTSICPTLQTILEGVQQELGDRVGKDVVLLSISVDPLNDTPQRLAAFAEDYHAGPGWYFLTGEPEQVVEVLRAFNAWTARKEEHSSMIVLGDETRGKWMFQQPKSPREIVRQLEALCSSD